MTNRGAEVGVDSFRGLSLNKTPKIIYAQEGYIDRKGRVWYRGKCGEYSTEYAMMFAFGFACGEKRIDYLDDCVIEYEDGETISACELIRKHFPGRI